MTAEFNRNVLHVLNRELGADFDPDAFEHVAFFDRRARVDRDAPARAARLHACASPALDLDVDVRRGEEMRTEISAKFTRERAGAPTRRRRGSSSTRRGYTDPDGAVRASRRWSRAARRIGSRADADRRMQRDRRRRRLGLGEATARALHERGAHVAIADLNAREGRRRWPTSSASGAHSSRLT